MPDFAKAVLGRLFPELVSYLPLIPLLQEIANAADAPSRARAILALLKFGASRSSTIKDDEFLAAVEPVLRTPEGARLAQWVADNLTSGIFAMEGPQP